MSVLALIGPADDLLTARRWRGAGQTPPGPVAEEPRKRLPDAAGEEEPEERPWMLRLVDAAHPVTEADVPPLEALPNGMRVDARVIDALEAMLAAARDAGLAPVVCSGYRTGEQQQALYEEEVEGLVRAGMRLSRAEAQARFSVAYPGASEHEIGIAVDIVALSHQMLDEKQADTPEARWLAAHCQEYGFIVRYPDGKSGVTGVRYEPWHFRYVGEQAAREIMAGGLCLEEYLAARDSQGE